MNDRKLLLAAIRDNPDEDTPRLAFADWLDERGDSFFSDWADLIRTQVEFARTERFSPRWYELARRQGELFDKRKRDWTPTWNSRLGVSAFRRGFYEAGPEFYPAETFLRNADNLFAANPLRCVRLLGLRQAGKEAATAIVRHPGMERVETLDVGNNNDPPTFKLLRLLAPRMPRLRALGLSYIIPTAQAAGDLLAALALPNLAALDLSFSQMFQIDGHAERRPELLFHSPALVNLRWLDLSRTPLTRDAVRVLAHSTVIRGLRYLNLEGNAYAEDGWFGPDGAEELAAGPAVRGVEYLNLRGQGIGPHGLAALLATPLLATVRELRLDENGLGDEGAQLLAASPHAAGLRSLGLGGNMIGDAGAEALLASPHLAGLRILGLGLRDPTSAVARRLRERFPNPELRFPNTLTADFFEPIP